MNEKNLSKATLFYKIVILFTLGCFLGCVFETILCFFQRGYFESRSGLIYGPFNPVYGLGICVMALVLEHYEKTSSTLIAGAIMGGVIEYFCSWVQENIFNTLSWDYSNYFLNFDGRTSIYHMMWWGVLGLLFMKYLYPKVLRLIYKISEKHRTVIAISLSIFFIVNGLISGYASYRQSQRIKGVVATTNIEKFFDKHYPDELLNKVYPNKKTVQEKK